MKNTLVNMVLGIALKDIHSLIAFFGKLETKLEAFIEAEQAKAAQIDTEITHLYSERAQVLANVNIAAAVKDGVARLGAPASVASVAGDVAQNVLVNDAPKSA